jgi:hypothetical protein
MVPDARGRWTRAAARPGALLIAGLALALAPGCAPHRVAPPPLSPGAREAAFRAALAGREARGRAVDAAITVWARSMRSQVWPGVSAALSLRAPDGLRIRVASVFGTAFDGAAHGDSVVAVLPARGLGFAADAGRDALGLRRPGRLGVRLFSAAWRPPEAAWATGEWSRDTLALRWEDEGDSLRLEIGPDGLPAAITLKRGDSVRLHAAYRSWRRQSGIAWPSSIEVVGGDGALTLRCRIERLRFVERPGPARAMAQLPAGTASLEWPAFRRALEREGEVR